MRPDGSLRPPDPPSVLRLILATTNFLRNRTGVARPSASSARATVVIGDRSGIPSHLFFYYSISGAGDLTAPEAIRASATRLRQFAQLRRLQTP